MSDGIPTPAAHPRGRTTIRPRAVERLALAAVREPGRWWHGQVAGVRARAVVDEATAAVRLEVEVAHPIAARRIGADLRRHVRQRTGELTGLTVRRLDVVVVPVTRPRPRRVA